MKNKKKSNHPQPQPKPNRPLLGAHMSIAGGFDQAVARGMSIGCTTIQIFTKSNRQWHAKKLTTEEIRAFRDALSQATISPVIAHASYLLNLGSPDENLQKKSIAALAQELDRCDQLGIPYLVLHPGSSVGSDTNLCITRISQNINSTFEKSPGNTMILLETMAGQGTSVGNSFEQLAQLIAQIKDKKRIGVCIDTCHIFAAGYDFCSPTSYKQLWTTFDKTVGLHYIKAIHLNDSQKECGSKVDRHADIGKGKIGLEAFSLLLNDRQFIDTPKILETPKTSLDDDKRNLNTLLSLIK